MATKTINLTGAEVAVTGLDGAHAHITNMGADIIYAAKSAGISPGADGVVPIPAGNGNTLRGISGAVYLFGTGSVLIQSDDYVQPPSFRNSTASGGSGVDDIARAAVNEHAGNAEIHVTAAEKDKWNAFSNPNHLRNSNFIINQRNVSGTISTPGYFVDGWKLTSGSVTVNDDGTITLNGTIIQLFEKPINGTVTASASAGTASYDSSTNAFTLTAAGETISWAKLESGSIATPYIQPDYETDVARCHRYCVSLPVGRYNRASLVGTSAIQYDLVLPQPLRAIPSIETGTLGVIALNASSKSQVDTDFSFTFGILKNHLLVQATKTNGAIDSALYVVEQVILSADL